MVRPPQLKSVLMSDVPKHLLIYYPILNRWQSWTHECWHNLILAHNVEQHGSRALGVRDQGLRLRGSHIHILSIYNII